MLKKLHIALFYISLALLLSACGGGGGGGQTPQPPSISTHPANVSMVAGNNTTLSVIASGTSLSYQWQIDSGSGFTNISDSGVYSGSTSASLIIANTTTSMNGNKYRVVINGTTAPPATSDSATLTVAQPTKAVITVSIAGLPENGIQAGVISFAFKVPEAGVTPSGLVANDAMGAVTLLSSTITAGLSGAIYDATTHTINFGGFNGTGTTNGVLLKITCDIAANTVVSKSDFSVTSSTVEGIDYTSYPTASFPLAVTFE